LGVFAVAAAGVLCAFHAWRTHYLNSVSAAGPVQTSFSLLFFELTDYCGVRCAVTCNRRRRPGQARRRQGRLQITIVRCGPRLRRRDRKGRAEPVVLRGGVTSAVILATDPGCQRTPRPLGARRVRGCIGVLGQCGCRGPKTVDRLLGRREALGGQRDQAGHGRRYLGEGELGGDEARLQARGQDGVR
jgi:hypothetical protein